MVGLPPESPDWQSVDGRWGDPGRLAHLPPPLASTPARRRALLLSTAPVASAHNPRTGLAWVASPLLFQPGWRYRAHQAHATEHPATSHQRGGDARSTASNGAEGRNAPAVPAAEVLSLDQREYRLPAGSTAQMPSAGQGVLRQDRTSRVGGAVELHHER